MERIGVELEEAISIILANTKKIADIETVDLMDSGGRILAEDVRARLDNPPFARSPLDGFALRADDSKGAQSDAPVYLEVAGTVYAGDAYQKDIQPFQAIKITTGAPIPPGCDCVVRQEDVVFSNGRIALPFPLKAWQNYCFQGEDFKKGQQLVKKGTRLSYIETGILASAGINPVPVYRRPVIALLATGDEVVMPGRKLPPGKIYGSNLHMVYSRLKELNIDVLVVGQLGDNIEAVGEALKKAALTADGIITTGGVSVGDKDIFHQVLPYLGCRRLFWRVNMKPGTPVMFSRLGELPVLSLSGNPFAAITTFELLARPLLSQLTGDAGILLTAAEGRLLTGFEKASPGRRFIRGYYDREEVRIPLTDKHASGMLASMAGCNCLIDIAPGQKPLKAGDKVRFWKL